MPSPTHYITENGHPLNLKWMQNRLERKYELTVEVLGPDAGQNWQHSGREAQEAHSNQAGIWNDRKVME